jgi:ring-1,2-phenylacetyl-CoA epoxidase subunit PaaC
MDELTHKFILQLADNELILGHRISEWCGHGPQLEQDIALANIALDHVGQSRLYYQMAAEMEGNGKTEDDYPYKRLESEFYNVQLVEHENIDFGYTVVRSFFYDQFYFLLLEQLMKSSHIQLMNIAKSAIKEVKYHLRYSGEWMKRLGDGTEESHERIQNAVNDLYPYTGEMFLASEADKHVKETFGVDIEKIQTKWKQSVSDIISEATLTLPDTTWFHKGGKDGVHTEKLGYLLTELQYIQRAYPNMEW